MVIVTAKNIIFNGRWNQGIVHVSYKIKSQETEANENYLKQGERDREEEEEV